ncbi:MAG: undecaprenyl-diphosphate phosphatase [Planctomycetales bacterium]|nr:undecaprenyl-diphosphate phosphatase [Planctomycetales bacterium]
MSWWEAIIIGLVEGFTEYLPVSSTGHILLVQRALGIPESEAANAYAVCIQTGAILAVLGIYWQQVRNAVVGTLGVFGIGSGDANGAKLSLNLIVAFIPAAVVGLLFDDLIEEKLFRLWTIVAAWFVGGIAILFASYWLRSADSNRPSRSLPLEQMSWKIALGIGLIQCLAMWPGTSRSLVTICGGVLLGMSLSAAVEFSFLLGVITLLAATVYKAGSAGPVMLAEYSFATMIYGSLAAWVAAFVAVKWMVAYLKRNGMELFGYYRVGLAVVVGTCLILGVLSEQHSLDFTGPNTRMNTRSVLIDGPVDKPFQHFGDKVNPSAPFSGESGASSRF